VRSIEDDLAEVRRLVFRRLQGLEVEVFFFGSRVRGTASRTSDIDIAVLPAGALPHGLLAEIREDLDESRVPYRVEVIDLSATDAGFRDRVRREGVRWAA
jgi:predicted nucleotidyltransferase